MPPIAYALASDTPDRRRPRLGHRPPRHLGTTLASDTATPLAVLGGLILWLLPPGHPRWLEVGERYADIL